MHDRVSVNALCFLGSSLSELEGVWRELQPHRISFLGNLVVDDPEPARASSTRAATRSRRSRAGCSAARPLGAGRGDLGRAAGARSCGRSRRRSRGRPLDLRAHRWALDGDVGGAGRAFRRAVEPCLEPAREAGVALMIENAPQPYSDSHIGHTLRDTIAAAEIAGVGVLIDIFGVWNEAGLKASIERAVPMCSLVQVSDYTYGDRSYPCRSVPGDGVIPLRRIIAGSSRPGTPAPSTSSCSGLGSTPRGGSRRPAAPRTT